MRKRSSISRRLMWLNVLVSGAALIITAVALLIYDQSSFRQTLAENVSAQADVVGKGSVSALIFADPESASRTLETLDTVPSILAASVFDAQGRLFASYYRAPQYQITKVEIPQDGRSETFASRQLLVTKALQSGDRTVGYVVIKADTSALRTRLERYLIIVGGVLLLSLVAAILLSTAFRRNVAGPIVEMAETARTVSLLRDYSIRVPVMRSEDELRTLAESFNQMLAGIESRDIALDTERARLRAILDNAPVGILVAKARTGETLLANRAMEQILQEDIEKSQKPASEWKVMSANRQLVSPDERPLARALRGENAQPEEFIVVRNDGSEIWVRATASPIREKHGEITAGLLVVTEISAQKRAQEALLQSEKLAAAGRLAASISHEINNPLESVTNLLFIALADPTLPPELRRILEQADEELARVSHIATQTLRFYRQATNPTSVNMGQLIDSVLQLLGGKLRNSVVSIHREYLAHEPITCFEGELRQVITNLISNALDATTRSDGRIILRTRRVQNSSSQGPGIQITVADNGEGIPAELAARIFEPFYTTKGSRGTGLGLWVTQEIIAKHQGSIRMKSKPGHGTVFVIVLPFHGAAEAVQSARSA